MTGNIILRETQPFTTFLMLSVIGFGDDILEVLAVSCDMQDQLLMARPQSHATCVQELVARFLSIGLAQYDALYVLDTRKYNRLMSKMENVLNELRQREGDQRRALLPLLDHPNVQVRMKAAHALLAISPVLARKAFESVRASEIFPQAMYAGMSLRALDNGTYVPS